MDMFPFVLQDISNSGQSPQQAKESYRRHNSPENDDRPERYGLQFLIPPETKT